MEGYIKIPLSLFFERMNMFDKLSLLSNTVILDQEIKEKYDFTFYDIKIVLKKLSPYPYILNKLAEVQCNDFTLYFLTIRRLVIINKLKLSFNHSTTNNDIYKFKAEDDFLTDYFLAKIKTKNIVTNIQKVAPVIFTGITYNELHKKLNFKYELTCKKCKKFSDKNVEKKICNTSDDVIKKIELNQINTGKESGINLIPCQIKKPLKKCKKISDIIENICTRIKLPEVKKTLFDIKVLGNDLLYIYIDETGNKVMELKPARLPVFESTTTNINIASIEQLDTHKEISLQERYNLLKKLKGE